MRQITLLLRNGTQEDLKTIQNWCKENQIDFIFRYTRRNNLTQKKLEENKIEPLYYFSIFSDTKHYKELQSLIGNKLVTTDYADFGNITDCDDLYVLKFAELIKLLDKNTNFELKANRFLLDFIMPITDVKILEEIKNYSGHMTEHQRKMLEDRIKIVSGKINEVHEEFIDDMMAIHCDIKSLREKTGMNQLEFAKYFEIPYQTLESWENKKSCCPTYLFKLMKEKLYNKNKIVF